MKILILYVFHEHSNNVRDFIKLGLLDSPDREFIFISNNPQPQLNQWNFLNAHSNMHLFIRPNIGHDFGGWNDALFLSADALKQKIIIVGNQQPVPHDKYLYKLFDSVIFLNSTVVGPYIPSYCPCDWAECFTSKLSDKIVMTGISANFMGQNGINLCQLYMELYKIPYRGAVHIQSMAYSLNRVGLDVLVKYGLFKSGRSFPTDKWLLICSCEIGMSSILRHEGFSLFSFMKTQGEISPTKVDNTDNFWNQKIEFPLHEYMFVKKLPHLTFKEKARYDSC